MLAIWTSVVLLVAGLATAMTLGWRRYSAEPVKQEHEICGPTCYPRVKR
jgi:hypothetical protein